MMLSKNFKLILKTMKTNYIKTYYFIPQRIISQTQEATF